MKEEKKMKKQLFILTTLVFVSSFGFAENYDLDFDGNDYVYCGNDASLQYLSNYTFGAWLNMPNPSANYQPIFMKNSGNTSDMEIYGGNGGITIAHNRNSSSFV